MFKGYRTIIFNVVMMGGLLIKSFYPEAVTPDVEQVGEMLDLIETAWASIWGVGNMYFRAITNTKIGSSS